jgi:hypothetical protein
MARLNRRFGEELRRFLRERKLTLRGAAYAADLVVSASCVGNWRDGQQPTEDNVRAFFSYFDGVDVEYWVGLLNEAQRVAA